MNSRYIALSYVRLILTVSILLCYQAKSAFADESAWIKEAATAVEAFKAENYQEAYEKFSSLHEAGNLLATHYLGIMNYHGFYVEKDLDRAASAFYQASKNGEEGGLLAAAYWLAKGIYQNPDSKYYNEYAAYRLYSWLEYNGHADGAFLAGVFMLSRIDEAKDPKAAANLARESFTAAAKAGKVEANLFLFLLERDQIKSGEISKYTTLDALELVTKSENAARGSAAFELSAIYFSGEHVTKDDEKFLELLSIAADNGVPQASLRLGKAYLEGVVGDPDYAQAKFYLTFAKKEGVAGADRYLEMLEERIKREQKIDLFKEPEDWYLNFLATQLVRRGQSSTRRSTKKAAKDPDSIWGQETGSKFITYHRSGNQFWGSDGNSFQINGNTITGSDGSYFRVQGSTIYGSDGRSFNKVGSTIWGSDGSSYSIIGNTIMGATGSSCSNAGLFTRCY